jgi:hypothetical protein
MVKKKIKKPPTPLQIAHRKFLEKMGVTKKQLKARKEIREGNDNNDFRPDTIRTVRSAYD